MSGTVRRAVSADAPRLAALAEALGYPGEPEAFARRLEVFQGRPDHAVFAAQEGGRVEGWIHVMEVAALVDEPSALITGLVVDAGRHGHGLGRALVQRAEAWARERGLATVRVRSRDTRAEAHAFYESLGYARRKNQVLFRRDV